jgi:hypothetical protein
MKFLSLPLGVVLALLISAPARGSILLPPDLSNDIRLDASPPPTQLDQARFESDVSPSQLLLNIEHSPTLQAYFSDATPYASEILLLVSVASSGMNGGSILEFVAPAPEPPAIWLILAAILIGAAVLVGRRYRLKRR